MDLINNASKKIKRERIVTNLLHNNETKKMLGVLYVRDNGSDSNGAGSRHFVLFVQGGALFAGHASFFFARPRRVSIGRVRSNRSAYSFTIAEWNQKKKKIPKTRCIFMKAAGSRLSGRTKNEK